MSAIVKLPDSAIAAVGAKTPDEFFSKLAELLLANAVNVPLIAKLKTDFDASIVNIGELKSALETANTTITAQAGEIKNLSAVVGNPATMTEARITAIAKEAGTVAGSAKAVEALAAVGSAPATSAPVNVPAAQAGKKSFPELVAAECATGKSKPDAVMAAIKANPEAHAEWLKIGGKL